MVAGEVAVAPTRQAERLVVAAVVKQLGCGGGELSHAAVCATCSV